MFNKEFYPTPDHVIDLMLEGYEIKGVILEPSAGKGDIVDRLKNMAEVIACEKDTELAKILATKCKVIASDFFSVTSEQISHIDMIIMNPPYSNADKHILHAYDIAPSGCRIVALCNLQTVKNPCYKSREELKNIIDLHGRYTDEGNCFDTAERKTDVEIAIIHIQKPADRYNVEFEGFFLEDEEEPQENGVLQYNSIRDLVNRYVEAVKLFDQQITVGIKMNDMIGQFYGSSLSFQCTEEDKPKTRADFKKDLQKSAWKHIFAMMNMQKYATRQLRDDLNNFVEKQTHIPFTMRNIYRMLEIIIGTQGQRMDKALLEAFDNLTKHYDENRYAVEGWKTNSHYLINEKFILPWMVESQKWSWNKDRVGLCMGSSNVEIIEDMQKAMCFLTGMRYEECTTLRGFTNEIKMAYGQWYSWGFFEIKGYKKGTMHFKFQDIKLWQSFNKKVAELRGYPLPESMKKTEPKVKQTSVVTPEPEVSENGQLTLLM